MYSNLNHFTALIQFLGAFNFAYIITNFHEKIFTHVLCIKSRFDRRFNGKEKNLVEADYQSLIVAKDLTLDNGEGGTKPKKDSLIKEFENLKNKYDDEIDLLIKSIDKEKPIYSQLLFLLVGLYCIYDLILIALSNITHIQNTIYLILIALNSVTILVILVLMVLELLNLFKKYTIRRLNHLGVILISISTVVISLAFPVLNNAYLNYYLPISSNIEAVFSNVLICASFLIPLSSFIFVFIFLVLLYIRVDKRIEGCFLRLRKAYENLHKEKLDFEKAISFFKLDTVKFDQNLDDDFDSIEESKNKKKTKKVKSEKTKKEKIKK